MSRRIEMIEEYIVQQSDSEDYNPPSYIWNDNKGVLIRCQDCTWYGRADKRRFYRGMDCLNNHIDTIVPDKDFCSRAERREDG